MEDVGEKIIFKFFLKPRQLVQSEYCMFCPGAFCHVGFGNAKYAVVPHHSLDIWSVPHCAHMTVLLHASSTCSIVTVGVSVMCFVKKAEPK
jgi:hypothetical protein